MRHKSILLLTFNKSYDCLVLTNNIADKVNPSRKILVYNWAIKSTIFGRKIIVIFLTIVLLGFNWKFRFKFIPTFHLRIFCGVIFIDILFKLFSSSTWVDKLKLSIEFGVYLPEHSKTEQLLKLEKLKSYLMVFMHWFVILERLHFNYAFLN